MESIRQTLTIIDLGPDNEAAIQQVAQLLIAGFAHSPGVWKDIEGVIPDANGHGKPDILMAKSIAR
jgi:hypothetical protein